jgi:hypothetical protein
MTDENAQGRSGLTPRDFDAMGFSVAHMFVWVDGWIAYGVSRLSFEDRWVELAVVREGRMREMRLLGVKVELELLRDAHGGWPHVAWIVPEPPPGHSMMMGASRDEAAFQPRPLPADAERKTHPALETGRMELPPHVTTRPPALTGMAIQAPREKAHQPLQMPPQRIKVDRRAKYGTWWIINLSGPGQPMLYWTGHMTAFGEGGVSSDHLDAAQFDTAASAEFQATMLGVKKPWSAQQRAWS